MNKSGKPENLVGPQPGNANAVKSGIYSERLMGARAAELAHMLNVSNDLDDAGRVAVLAEVLRLWACIEAIDRQLEKTGLKDRKGKPSYLVQQRERYSRRLMEAHDRLVEAQHRATKHGMTKDSYPVEAETVDYVRRLQQIALGLHPEASVTHELAALKLLIEHGARGTSSYYRPRKAPYADDPEVAALLAELESAERTGYMAVSEEHHPHATWRLVAQGSPFNASVDLAPRGLVEEFGICPLGDAGRGMPEEVRNDLKAYASIQKMGAKKFDAAYAEKRARDALLFGCVSNLVSGSSRSFHTYMQRCEHQL